MSDDAFVQKVHDKKRLLFITDAQAPNPATMNRYFELLNGDSETLGTVDNPKEKSDCFVVRKMHEYMDKDLSPYVFRQTKKGYRQDHQRIFSATPMHTKRDRVEEFARQHDVAIQENPRKARCDGVHAHTEMETLSLRAGIPLGGELKTDDTRDNAEDTSEVAQLRVRIDELLRDKNSLLDDIDDLEGQLDKLKPGFSRKRGFDFGQDEARRTLSETDSRKRPREDDDDVTDPEEDVTDDGTHSRRNMVSPTATDRQA